MDAFSVYIAFTVILGQPTGLRTEMCLYTDYDWLFKASKAHLRHVSQRVVRGHLHSFSPRICPQQHGKLTQLTKRVETRILMSSAWIPWLWAQFHCDWINICQLFAGLATGRLAQPTSQVCETLMSSVWILWLWVQFHCDCVDISLQVWWQANWPSKLARCVEPQWILREYCDYELSSTVTI